MSKKSSVYIAKNRLKHLLTSDRVSVIPDSYDTICNELYYVLSKYMEITKDDFYVEINRTHIIIKFSGEET